MLSNSEFWIPIVGEGWYKSNIKLFNSSFMFELLSLIDSEYKTSIVYPAKKDIFKAFKLCPWKDVRVIILGQDPYYTEQNGIPDATGLAFANPDTTIKVNPSLKKIHETIEKECYDGVKLVPDITLESWAKQGVLLLNTALTVKKYSPTSHSRLWRGFTEYILKSLYAQKNGLHFVLWGNHAKSFKYLVDTKVDLWNDAIPKHYIYESVHPSFAARKNVDWKCSNFNEINKNITYQNGKDYVICW